MCGICGIFHVDRTRRADRNALAAMNCRITHRGPDEEGFYLDENIGLAMRRLSIIDLKTGQQPVSNEDGSAWIVFNGEIYNHMDLRAELEARGHRIRSRSDTETIVHLYEEYGRECVQHLRGMFAFAIWDVAQRRLFLARDRLGIKPLYYRFESGTLLFGSEIKAILAHPGCQAQFRQAALPEYLAFGYLSGPETMFQGICKLPPGHTLELDEAGRLKIEQYWDPPQPSDEPEHSERYYVEAYCDQLEGAVRSHLMSDVPLGVFLSGGLDSSAVAALMTRIRREPIETFSVGYEEEAFSELSYARSVAEHIGSLHHEVRVSRQDFFEALPKLIWHEDEPLVWPSSVSLYFVAKLARERVTVVLTGEGSDETLGGYGRYAWTILNAQLDRAYRSLIPAGLRRKVREFVAGSKHLDANTRRKLSHTFLQRDGACWSSFYFDNFYAAFSEADQNGLLARDFNAPPGAAYAGPLRFWESASGDLLRRLLYTDIKTYLVELCMKQDQMSMAASIESRVPFLDHQVVEFALSIPSRYKIRGKSGKYILKEAMRGLLPGSIIDRRKMGFPTPITEWLLGPQLDSIEELLLSPRSLSRGLFRPEALRGLFAEHRSRQRDHADRIWRLLNLELWQRVCIEGHLGD